MDLLIFRCNKFVKGFKVSETFFFFMHLICMPYTKKTQRREVVVTTTMPDGTKKVSTFFKGENKWEGQGNKGVVQGEVDKGENDIPRTVLDNDEKPKVEEVKVDKPENADISKELVKCENVEERVEILKQDIKKRIKDPKERLNKYYDIVSEILGVLDLNKLKRESVSYLIKSIESLERTIKTIEPEKKQDNVSGFLVILRDKYNADKQKRNDKVLDMGDNL